MRRSRSTAQKRKLPDGWDPNTSAHVSGDAVDIRPDRATAWLSEHGAEYGLCQIYSNEPWHYELRPDTLFAVARPCTPTQRRIQGCSSDSAHLRRLWSRAARSLSSSRDRRTVFDGFTLEEVDVGEVVLRVRHGGQGRAVVLLHGHPRTHATWHWVAPLLARHTVVCPDLRGYGRSTLPPDQPDHAQSSKRAMANDVVALMQNLGHEQFAVAGHDRGALVALPPLDHPQLVRLW